eukprot:SAG31_NODE_38877_length_292_cov_1.341969_1_plen_44_part_10
MCGVAATRPSVDDELRLLFDENARAHWSEVRTEHASTETMDEEH